MQFTASIAAAILAFTSSTSAHMLLANPVPFGNVNSDPLNGFGTDFPCKAGDYAITTMNNWAAGSTQQVSFYGSAVHAGGSCQFSFTTDQKPTKSSVWKVVHSVIGGCPKAGVNGNLLPEDAMGTGSDKFDVMIPKDIPNGQLTFAWTWFNKMGNREMYMACAPVTITGGSDSTEAFGALPDMFVANAPNSTCLTQENFDITFPNPGASVVELGDPAAKGTPGFSGSGCPTGGSTPVAPPATNPGNGQVNVPSPAPVPVQPAPVVPPPVAPAPGGTTCTTDGALICISSTMFGICNGGSAIPQAVAPGTTCTNGAISRRAVRHPRRHGSSMVRRHGSAFKA